jgi:hypothetical protein
LDFEWLDKKPMVTGSVVIRGDHINERRIDHFTAPVTHSFHLLYRWAPEEMRLLEEQADVRGYSPSKKALLLVVKTKQTPKRTTRHTGMLRKLQYRNGDKEHDVYALSLC